jgi:hypothetical protein
LLQRNIDLINQLKDRISQLEQDNLTLSHDNSELRLQSLEGFELAKTAERLSDEREVLSIDIADKAKAIRLLLAENSKLKDQITQTVKRAYYYAARHDI